MDSKKLITNLETLISVICDMQIPFDEICENLCSIKWDPNANTFYDMDMDELDVIGKSLKVPVYQFLKESLTRKYGEEWYNELTVAAEMWKVEKKNNKK